MRLLAIDFVGCAFFGTKKGNQDRAWVDMRLHESHEEGGFGVSHNTITRHAASYTTNARFVAFLGTFARPAQQVWLPVFGASITWKFVNLYRIHTSPQSSLEFGRAEMPASLSTLAKAMA